MPSSASRNSPPTRQTAFDYDRTVIAFHGTYRNTAKRLIAGEPFRKSENDDDWLGHGIYFWEYAPQKAWEWAAKRYGAESAAVVGSLVRLGRCLDLLDPSNTGLLSNAHKELRDELIKSGASIPRNANASKLLDCAVFNYLYEKLSMNDIRFDSARAVFVPLKQGRGLPRLWERSGVFDSAHIQLSVREPNNILAVWPVRKDGRYGEDEE